MAIAMIKNCMLFLPIAPALDSLSARLRKAQQPELMLLLLLLLPVSLLPYPLIIVPTLLIATVHSISLPLSIPLDLDHSTTIIPLKLHLTKLTTSLIIVDALAADVVRDITHQ